MTTVFSLTFQVHFTHNHYIAFFASLCYRHNISDTVINNSIKMLGLKIAVAFCIVASFTGVKGDDDHAEASINFKEDTFAEQVAKKPHLVMFFAPW